jgi:signal transduction histidine kinase
MTTARRYTRSSSFKMALLFTILCGIAVLILSYFIYYFNHDSFIRTVDTSIDTDIKYVDLIKQTLPGDIALNHYLAHLPQSKDRLYIFSATKSTDLSLLLKDLPVKIDRFSEGLLFFNYEHLQYASKIHTFADGSRLLVGMNITPMVKDQNRMLYLSLVSIVLMLMVIGISYVISSFVVSRTNRIVLRAKEIMETGDLSRRLEVDSDWDDLSYMTNVLNLFLTRIELLMQGVRQVSDNIAHDLRTPLTRMRHKIDRLKDAKFIDQSPSVQTIATELSDEADHLLNAFNALLRISRIEAGRQHSPFQTIALNQLIHDVIELYEPLAEEKSLHIKADLIAISCLGDRDLLFQAVANLLDNAVKFTPAQGGDIYVTLSANNKALTLAVRDQGPGIETEHQTKVFERYYRADTSRHLPGNGLGLSLVMAIIRLHHGEIALHTPVTGGLSVVITMPLSVPITTT